MAEIEICPNCGRKLDGSEFQPTWDMPLNWLPTSVDPVMGRFRCPDCNFNGISVKVDEKEYPKMEFSRERFVPPPRRGYRRFAALIFIFFVGVPLLAYLSFNPLAALLWLALVVYSLRNAWKA